MIRSTSPTGIAIRLAIAGLALATGYIHLGLGSLLFTLNGIGYAVAAVAMLIPLGIAVRFRWLVRIGLIGYAAATIVGWYLMGPRIEIAYLSKAIELGLIGLVLVEIRLYDGSPIRRVRGFDLRPRRA
jgi:hypothetical protein